MRRRAFLKTSAGAGFAAGAAFALGGYEKLWASSSSGFIAEQKNHKT